MRQMICESLENAGFEVQGAEDGVAAVELLDGGFVPDLVVTDLNMPRMNGIELVRELRARADSSFIPILLLTTESQEERKREAKQAGATGWLVKPFNPEKLLQVVDRVLPGVLNS